MKMKQNNFKKSLMSSGLLCWIFIGLVLSIFVSQQALAQPKVSDLVVSPPFSGGTIKWYTASSGDNQIANPAATNLLHGTTYYASQTVNGVESTERRAVTANITTVSAPTARTHTATATSVTWNWNAVSGASGYKWSETNNYGSATNLGNVLTLTRNSLSCNTSYTIYVWAYDVTGCYSNSVSLSKTTNSCTHTGGLTAYRGQTGTFEFLVTGSTTGSIWGGCSIDDYNYTDDTWLETAAVHSGQVLNGETKYVTVQITAGRLSYGSCTNNGVTSAIFGNWEGSYKIISSR